MYRRPSFDFWMDSPKQDSENALGRRLAGPIASTSRVMQSCGTSSTLTKRPPQSFFFPMGKAAVRWCALTLLLNLGQTLDASQTDSLFLPRSFFLPFHHRYFFF